MASRADLVAEACYRAACPDLCGRGVRAIETDGGWAHVGPAPASDWPRPCLASPLRAAVAALPPLPDRDAASETYEAPDVAHGSDSPYRAIADSLLLAIHARCFAWRPDGSGPLPPEQTPRGNRLAVIAAACEAALAGEEVRW